MAIGSQGPREDKVTSSSHLLRLSVGITVIFIFGQNFESCFRKFACAHPWKCLSLGRSLKAKCLGGRLCLAGDPYLSRGSEVLIPAHAFQPAPCFMQLEKNVVALRTILLGNSRRPHLEHILLENQGNRHCFMGGVLYNLRRRHLRASLTLLLWNNFS